MRNDLKQSAINFLMEQKGNCLASDLVMLVDFVNKIESEKTVKKEWYEDIPESGVLCKVWDRFENIYIIASVSSYNKGESHPFELNNSSFWENAKPLTNDEIMEYLK